MTRITDEDRRAISGATPQILVRWWCLLNKYEWPRDGLGMPDPVVKPWQPDTRRGDIMREIVAFVGMQACLREWNRESMSDAQFEEWWDSHGAWVHDSPPLHSRT